MIGHDVDGPLGAVLGHPQGLRGWPRAALRVSVGGPGSRSGPLWVVLGRSQGLCVVLDRSQGICGWSWATFRASVGGPGLLSRPLWVVLGRCQGLCGRSWATIRPESGPNPSGRAIPKDQGSERVRLVRLVRTRTLRSPVPMFSINMCPSKLCSPHKDIIGKTWGKLRET